MSARMSAIEVLSGLVLLTLSFVGHGRVEMWRGCCRLNISVAASFVWRCLSGSAMTPFPHPAHRTGQADLPHPALGVGWDRGADRASNDADVSSIPPIIPYGGFSPVRLEGWLVRRDLPSSSFSLSLLPACADRRLVCLRPSCIS